MKIIEPIGLPVCRFAHTYAAPSYRHHFKKRSGLLEITYIKEGKLTLIRGKDRQIAKKSDIIFNCFTADTLITSDEYHCHHTVGFSFEYLPIGEPPFVISPGKNSSQIYHLIDEMINLKGLSPDSDIKLSGLFLQLIGELQTEAEHSTSGGYAESRYVKAAKQYICDNLTLPIRQSDVAEMLGITPEYLCSIFKKSTGETVMRFINRSKLSGIRSLMEREGIPLYRAAEHYGFSDPNYVSRLYVRLFGECISRGTRR